MTIANDIRIIVYKEDDHYIAQCLEYDICTQAGDRDTLRDRMACLIECEIRAMEESNQAIDAAPERFHNMWDKGDRLSYREVAA